MGEDDESGPQAAPLQPQQMQQQPLALQPQELQLKPPFTRRENEMRSAVAARSSWGESSQTTATCEVLPISLQSSRRRANARDIEMRAAQYIVADDLNGQPQKTSGSTHGGTGVAGLVSKFAQFFKTLVNATQQLDYEERVRAAPRVAQLVKVIALRPGYFRLQVFCATFAIRFDRAENEPVLLGCVTAQSPEE
ncbi:unnamed protein product [Gongylonema pulchrum]|uniref:Uncharacterized protein n=1 Tax=Gongylonema pulchrum TaxID=637853 RepID=A0A183DH20_9BILA|nr:unnamed protein product [Gongylonema pulchrum]